MSVNDYESTVGIDLGATNIFNKLVNSQVRNSEIMRTDCNCQRETQSREMGIVTGGIWVSVI